MKAEAEAALAASNGAGTGAASDGTGSQDPHSNNPKNEG